MKVRLRVSNQRSKSNTVVIVFGKGVSEEIIKQWLSEDLTFAKDDSSISKKSIIFQ